MSIKAHGLVLYKGNGWDIALHLLPPPLFRQVTYTPQLREICVMG